VSAPLPFHPWRLLLLLAAAVLRVEQQVFFLPATTLPDCDAASSQHYAGLQDSRLFF